MAYAVLVNMILLIIQIKGIVYDGFTKKPGACPVKVRACTWLPVTGRFFVLAPTTEGA